MKTNLERLIEFNLNPETSSLSDLRNKLVTFNMMRKKRWQIVSDDHVWFYPADISLSTVELDSFAYKDTPYESCIFYANGESEVLARYKTKKEAIAGHIKLSNKYELKRISLDDFNV